MARKSSVEKLKDKLYSRSGAPATDTAARTPLSSTPTHTPHTWEDIHTESPSAPSPPPQAAVPEAGPAAQSIQEKPPPLSIEHMPQLSRTPPATRHAIARYFFIGSMLFFIVAAAVASYEFFGGANTISSSNIDFQIVAPSLIDSGKQATVEFIVDNRNQTTLKTADLLITYPSGTRDATNPSQTLTHERLSLGDIAPGTQEKQTVEALFYGSEGVQDNIQATLEYQITGSNAIFTKDSNTFLTIGSAPVTLTVTAPSEAISGQAFSMDVTVQSNTSSVLDNVAIEVQYPFGFSAMQSTPPADVGNTLWRLGTLSPGDSKTVHLTGTLTGEDGDERVFHFLSGAESDLTESHIAIPLLTTAQTITIHKPFVSGVISLDGQTGTTVPEPLGKNIQGRIDWQNNSSSTISNLTFTLSLSGAALDPASVRSSAGFYDSTKGAIIWSPTQNATLAAVSPGTTGTLDFSFSTIPPTTSVFTNPTVALGLSLVGTEQGVSGAPNNVSSAASVSVSLASAVALAAQALHFTGAFAGQGPMPPKVGTPTTYTVVWTVKNSSNTIAGSSVEATLPPYMTFVASAPGGETVSYDDASRTVTWNLGDVKAGVGYATAARAASFQVSVLPSLSQVGTSPALTGDATFSGEDRFAQATVTAHAPAPTTNLMGDAGFQSSMGIIVQ